MKIMTHISIVALFVAAGIATSRAQTLTPVGVSMTDPTAVNPIVTGLTDVALGTSAIDSIPANEVTNYATLGGPGIATASANTSIGGDLFGPFEAIDGIIRIDNPAAWDGTKYDANLNPWLPVDQTPDDTRVADWLVVDLNATKTIGMIVIEGRFNNRTFGLYTFQYTTDPAPVSNSGSTWTTIGSFSWMPPTPFGAPVLPRLAFPFPAIPNVTGIQVLCMATNVSGGGGLWGDSIQELEVYGPFTSGPVITSSPQGTNGLVGLNLTLSVTANNVTGFQWYKDGVPVGPNNNTYVVSTSAQTTDTGTYKVVVTNNLNTATSIDAVVNIAFPATPTLIQNNAVILSYAPVPQYVFTMQTSPTLVPNQFATFSTWFTTVNGQILTATPVAPANQFFRLIQTTP